MSFSPVSISAEDQAKLNNTTVTEPINLDEVISYKRTEVNDADYTVLITDRLIVITNLTAPRTITLPVALANRGFTIKDESGLAAMFPITIDVEGGGTIDTKLSTLLRTAFTAIKFYSDANEYFALESAKNNGQIKINDGNGAKPSTTWGGGGNPSVGTFVRYEYDLPLTLAATPTTRSPRNIDVLSDSDIYDDTNETFIENTVPGQGNAWRMLFSFSGKGAGLITGVEVRLRNTISGFISEKLIAIPSERTSGIFVVDMFTIADTASLPAPFGTGQGYVLELAPDDNITIVMDSITRFNSQAD